jgi:hypothetical protein
MARTSDQLIERVLLDLNVIGHGQTAADEDAAFVSDVAATTFAELNARDVVNISDADAIDDALFEPLVEYLVAKLGPSYGRPVTGATDLLLIEDRIKDVTRPAGTRGTLATDPVLRHGARPFAR